MTVVDGLESLPQCAGMATASVAALRSDCLECLSRLGQTVAGKAALVEAPAAVEVTPTSIRIGAFGIQRGSLPASDMQFHFNAPTTALNAMRVLRACQLPKAILLEGSPGVGKTSLVAALAAISGFHLQRINLSDQTDLIDLFGSDLPVEGGKAGEFRWRDAAFLDAMQKGDWVLLDEMNLASQTVLEGLNAVLDYRGTVYIPELGRSFARHPNFRVFAAQNPLQQGGGRKGLPKSFLNRFTKVYLQEHTADDLLLICQQLYPMPVEIVQKLIAFNEEIRIATTVDRTIGREGSPWEFNLRDLFRWFGVLDARNGLELSHHPAEFLRMIYLERFRNQADRDAVQAIFERVFETSMTHFRPMPLLTPSRMQIGHATAARAGDAAPTATIRHEHLDVAESVLKAVELGWLVILAGESGGGKRSLVRTIAGEAGRGLGEFTMHPGVDTSEILGSFEQQDHRIVRSVYADIVGLLDRVEDGGVSIGDARAVLSQAHDALQRDNAQTDRFQSVCQAVLQRLPGDAETTAVQHELSLIPTSDSAATGFAWVDGQLIDALRTGGWYLISDANLCSPSVLDRLNSLCESNGSLILSEKGSTSGIPEVIRPHPDFRLFMTYDPRFGELSRAMRNRGIELYLQPSPLSVRRSALSDSAVLSDSLLRSAWLMEGVDAQNPSAVANGIAGSVRASLSHLARLVKVEESDAGGGMFSSAVDWAQGNAPKSSEELIEVSYARKLLSGRNTYDADYRPSPQPHSHHRWRRRYFPGHPDHPPHTSGSRTSSALARGERVDQSGPRPICCQQCRSEEQTGGPWGACLQPPCRDADDPQG
jgi:midasin